jgi:hypothetical protein
MIYEELILAVHNVAKSKYCEVIVNLFLKTPNSPFKFQEFEARRLQDNRNVKVPMLSALSTGCFYPQEMSLYSFLLDFESIPEPECGWEGYVSEKFQ